MPPMSYQTRFSLVSAAATGLVWSATAAMSGWLIFLATSAVWPSIITAIAAATVLLRVIRRSEDDRRLSSARTLRRAALRIKERDTADRHAKLAAHGLKPLSKS